MIIKCKRCGYKWNTKSKLYMVSCPSCGTKNKKNTQYCVYCNAIVKPRTGTHYKHKLVHKRCKKELKKLI